MTDHAALLTAKSPAQGDLCPDCGWDRGGTLQRTLDGDCACMVVRHPPCGACENAYLVCDDCGREFNRR